MVHPWITESIRALLPRSHQLCRECLGARNRRHAAPPQLLFRRSLLHSQSGPPTGTTTPDIVPLRKQLKDEARKKRAVEGFETGRKKGKTKDPRLEDWELTVGIEIHAQLNTDRKLFSSCEVPREEEAYAKSDCVAGAAASVSDSPNSHVALFDVAFPGTQPVCFTMTPGLRAGGVKTDDRLEISDGGADTGTPSCDGAPLQCPANEPLRSETLLLSGPAGWVSDHAILRYIPGRF